MIAARFKSPKFYLPLLGTLALGIGAFGGVAPAEAAQADVAAALGASVEAVEGALKSLAGVLALVTGWFGRPAAEPS